MINLQCHFTVSSICLLYHVSYAVPFPYSNTEVQRNTEKKPDADDDGPIEIVQFLRQEIAKWAGSKRVKRDSSGKFSEAAKAPMIKVVRQMLQLFRNTWAFEPIGGKHPLDPDVAYGVVYLFKTGLWDYFFPGVGYGGDIAE